MRIGKKTYKEQMNCRCKDQRKVKNRKARLDIKRNNVNLKELLPEELTEIVEQDWAS